jgi:hypothetical protein
MQRLGCAVYRTDASVPPLYKIALAAVQSEEKTQQGSQGARHLLQGNALWLTKCLFVLYSIWWVHAFSIQKNLYASLMTTKGHIFWPIDLLVRLSLLS